MAERMRESEVGASGRSGDWADAYRRLPTLIKGLAQVTNLTLP